ncbi:MAG TPA: hypothetical protein VIB38_05070 [Aestuariivirgaceae bacterium]
MSLRDYIDARIGQVTAENNTHFAELRADIEKLSSAIEVGNDKIASVPKMWQLIVTIVAAAAGTLTIMLGIMAFGGDRFDAGMGMSATTVENSVTARTTAEENERRLNEITLQMNENWERVEIRLKKVDELLPAIEALVKQTNATPSDLPNARPVQ